MQNINITLTENIEYLSVTIFSIFFTIILYKYFVYNLLFIKRSILADKNLRNYEVK